MEKLSSPNFGIYVPLAPLSARNAGEIANDASSRAAKYLESQDIAVAVRPYAQFGVTLIGRRSLAAHLDSLAGLCVDEATLVKRVQHSIRPIEDTLLPMSPAIAAGTLLKGRTWGLSLQKNSDGVQYVQLLGEELNNAGVQMGDYPLPLKAADTIPLFKLGKRISRYPLEEQHIEKLQEISDSAFERWDRGRQIFRFGRMVIGPSMAEPLPGSEA